MFKKPNGVNKTLHAPSGLKGRLKKPKDLKIRQ